MLRTLRSVERGIERFYKNLRPGSLALLYGYVHRSVKEFCRDPPTAPRAPFAVHPAAPGASAPQPGNTSVPQPRYMLYTYGCRRGLLEGIETVTWLWNNNNKWPRKEPGRRFNLSIILLSDGYSYPCSYRIASIGQWASRAAARYYLDRLLIYEVNIGY